MQEVGGCRLSSVATPALLWQDIPLNITHRLSFLNKIKDLIFTALPPAASQICLTNFIINTTSEMVNNSVRFNGSVQSYR